MDQPERKDIISLPPIEINGYAVSFNGFDIDIMYRIKPYTQISWQPLAAYKNRYPRLSDPDIFNIQVVEIGPGLSQCIPVLARLSDVKPIAIDPIDLGTVTSILESAKKKDISGASRSLVNTLIERAEILQSDDVEFYNMTLDEAVNTYPERLKHVADLVIDYNGALTYSGDVRKTLRQEFQFLQKPFDRSAPQDELK